MAAAATLTEQLSAWASALRYDDIPPRVLALAKSQVLSQLAAARAGMEHPLGQRLMEAFGPPVHDDPRQSASSLAALTAWLHLDDTAYAGHISHSAVNVALAYARALRLDGRRLLAAVVAADECAARLTAAATLGPYRGQSATHAHLAGTVAARLHCAGAPAPSWVDALGLALGMPPAALMRGFLGSDSNLLSALTPVRAGLDACDAATVGLRGAPDIVEHPQGFLARFCDVGLPETVVEGLGRRWHTDTLSFKVHPCGPGMDAAVDCAAELSGALGPLDVDDVEKVVVDSSLYTIAVDAAVQPYLRGGDSPVSALTVSLAYTVATALLTGSLVPHDFAPPYVGEPARWALAHKVSVRHDPVFTRQLLTSEAPLGEALRAGGSRAAQWLAGLGLPDAEELVRLAGPPSTSFEHAAKATGALVCVQLRDGRSLRAERDVPRGAAGGGEDHATVVREKFLATGGSTDVADVVSRLEDARPGDVSQLLARALRRSACPTLARRGAGGRAA